MRISYSYSNYPHSRQATKWSKRASYFRAMSVIFVALWAFVIIIPFALFEMDNEAFVLIGLVVAIAGGILIHRAIVNACRRKEREWAAFDGIRMQIGRELTDAEKQHVRRQLEEQQRAGKR